MWTVRLSKQASRFIESYGGKQRILFESGLRELATDPYSGKPLVGELKGYWSYRVGNFRMIYVIDGSRILVEILRVQHRKEVYEKLRRL